MAQTPSGTHSYAYAHQSHKNVDEERAVLIQMLVGRQIVDAEKEESVFPSTADSLPFPDKHPKLFDKNKSRWIGIDKAANTKSKKKFSEEDLYDPLIEIIKAVLKHFRLDDHFVILTARIEQRIKESRSWSGRTQPFATACRQLALPLEALDGNRIDCKQDDLLKWASSCVDAKKGAFQKKDITQVISYMKRILLSQPGRRFVYTALVSEAKYELIVLDERGTLRSQAFDYNKNSHDLVHLILLLTGATPGLNGFHKGLSRDVTGLQLACGDYKFHIELPVAWPRLTMFGRCTEGMVAVVVQ